MRDEGHFKNLENMYKAAPVNELYNPVMVVSEGRAEIEIDVLDKYFHSAGAVHGSVYFKMLDDAAFFAANSLEDKYFVLTVSFTTYLTRPVSMGKLKSIGRVVNKNNSQFITESVLYDDQKNEVARGSGIFVKGKFRLEDSLGYGKVEKF